MEPILADLSQYGVAGIFIGYLIYDRQVILKKITKALEDNTHVLQQFLSRCS